MFRLLRAARFLVIAPFLLLVLFVISRMTGGGSEWFRWAALAIGIVWVISLLRVIQGLLVVGGLAAIFSFLRKRS
ncbi:MAG: hypothetical protein HY076_05825 [Candidatus Eisenbacteria bacterium]|uniref:Uncharacterized protein n=1 Tax=Eiseniibacteriota bacterium TaxID=2212470 RepID=A0A9D6L4P4_UNCEI|nr:hypothetical protein [Candidatus Eisenbacteria bacterium]MBI3539772.1 hypothetical protein [Candidatus Eisenbacteria bacterium]